MIEEKTLDCGESRTTASLSMIPVASGVAGEGVFVFTGREKLRARGFRPEVDLINQRAIAQIRQNAPIVSMAMPANADYHMPVRVYVGEEAIERLAGEIRSGRYDSVKEIITKFTNLAT